MVRTRRELKESAHESVSNELRLCHFAPEVKLLYFWFNGLGLSGMQTPLMWLTSLPL